MTKRIQESVDFFHARNELDNENEKDENDIEMESNCEDKVVEHNNTIDCTDRSDTTSENIQTIEKSKVFVEENIANDSLTPIDPVINSQKSPENGIKTDVTNGTEIRCVQEDGVVTTPKVKSMRLLMSTLIDSNFKPVIAGDSKKLIDLETGELIDRKPTGVECLMERAMSSMKKPKKNAEKDVKTPCSILSVEDGKMELLTLNINTRNVEESDKNTIKPRAHYVALKKHLKDIMRNKRLEELKKRSEETTEHADKNCQYSSDEEEVLFKWNVYL